MPWLFMSARQRPVRDAVRLVRASGSGSGPRSPACRAARPCAFQSGRSSFSARGSMIAPDRMCAPTSEPFSSTQTETSRCRLRRRAASGGSPRRGPTGRRRRSRRRTPWLRVARWRSSCGALGERAQLYNRAACVLAGRRGGLASPCADAAMTHKPRLLVHTSRQAIRWGDMDALGHVNNTVYFRYMEQARIEWVVRRCDPTATPYAGTGPVDRQRELHVPACRSSIRATSRCGCIWATRAARASAATTRSSTNGTKYADGAAKIVWIDLASGRTGAAARRASRRRCARDWRRDAMTRR